MSRVHVRATRVGNYDSKMEKEYADRLELLRRAGEIAEWRHKAMRFRIGAAGEKTSRAFYSPDFTVLNLDGTLSHIETKGRWMEAAKVRIRAAAELYPWFEWIAVTRVKGNWTEERFGR